MIIDVLNGLADNITKDTFSYNSTNSVIIECHNRGDPVVGILSEALKLSVKAEYKDFTNIGSAKGVIEAADATMTALTGATVQQPWFARQYWTSTSPLTLSVRISFVATESAKEQVWDPIERLIGFHYPRQLTDGTNGLAELYAPPGPNLFSGKTVGSNNISNSFLDGTKVGDKLTIKGADEPDYVSLHVGNMITLEMCYLLGSEITFSSILDPDGYPHSATATVNIRAFDGSYWPLEGTFQLTQKAGIAFNVGNAVDTIKKAFGFAA